MSMSRHPRRRSVVHEELREAVKEYYARRRCRSAHAVNFIRNGYGDEQLLVRYRDEDGEQKSALMTCDEYGREWEVEESDSCGRDEEYVLIRDFKRNEPEQIDYDVNYDDEDIKDEGWV